MQYAKMIDLIEQAKEAGSNETEFVNDRLYEAFEGWLDRINREELTEEEEHTLHMAFEEGYGICFHGSK